MLLSAHWSCWLHRPRNKEVTHTGGISTSSKCRWANLNVKLLFISLWIQFVQLWFYSNTTIPFVDFILPAHNHSLDAGFLSRMWKVPAKNHIKMYPTLDKRLIVNEYRVTRGPWVTIGTWMATLALIKGVKTPLEPLTSLCLCLLFSGEWAKIAKFRLKWITRPKGGILKTARPTQTRPNCQIPVQSDRMAGL